METKNLNLPSHVEACGRLGVANFILQPHNGTMRFAFQLNEDGVWYDRWLTKEDIISQRKGGGGWRFDDKKVERACVEAVMDVQDVV